MIHNLFPTPIYQADLKKPISNKILNNKVVYRKNTGNDASVDTYILEKTLYSDLKKECQSHLEEYYRTIINTKNNVTPYITQSWLNKTKEKGHHPLHTHPNSIISGVVYFNADPNKDNIRIQKPLGGHSYALQFLMYPKEYNAWNSNDFVLPVKSNSIILFPSYLPHSVDIKNSSNIRTSLSFNTFVKGTLGYEVDLDLLQI
jgi:uncharacterized protein (TIGR02466 family)|tara:strand:- start:507 stop:1112 length:606 start_codon:yes stop_codon:yes gene_type:complete